jgi:hypothetical protein
LLLYGVTTVADFRGLGKMKKTDEKNHPRRASLPRRIPV